MKAILNSLKPNMRRLLAFALACLTAASAMAVFTVSAAAAPAVSDTKVWKWKRVASKSDVKAILNGSYNDVTVPVYLCWETPDGESYVLQGVNGGTPNGISDGFAYFYRDGSLGRYGSCHQMPEEIASQYKKYLQENYSDKVAQSGGIDVFFLFYGANYIDEFYNNVVKNNKAAWATSPAAKRFFADDGLCNRMSWMMMGATGGFPKGVSTSSERSLFYGSETFYTDTNTSDISMTIKSDLTVSFKCGKYNMLYQPMPFTVQGELVSSMGPGLGWLEFDVSSYSEGVRYTLEPSDTKNDRAQYTDEGKLQLVQTIKERTCGLCFEGNYLNVLAQYDEKKPTYFSNFTLYYGVESKISEIDGDYAIKKGTTQNFNNNLVIGDGSRLVVEPGAVVTVTGLLQNKGTIENCGTIVVNENSAILTTGSGTINNYGNSVDVPSMYYRTKVALATAEYNEKFEQLSKEMGYAYYNPMAQIESDIDLYAQLVENFKNVSAAFAYYKELYDQACAEKEALLKETEELRGEYEYFRKNRDKIIRDAIASYYNDEMSRADATAEYEKKLAELEAEVNEKYTKPKAALEKELEELKSATLSESWQTMSVEERTAWFLEYNSKRQELNDLIEKTQDLVSEYEEYGTNRDQIIEEIYIAHGGVVGTMTLAEAAEEYGKQLAALKEEVDEKYTKPEAKLKAELDSLELTYEQRAQMSQEEYAEWSQNRVAKQAEYNKLIEDTKALLAEYEDFKNNRDAKINEIYEEHGGKRADTGDTITYTDCAGDLIVLEKGALFFNDLANEPVSFYSGATFLNAGVAVLPRGFLVSHGEIQNLSTGHIFAGFYMADTTFNGTTVSKPGTKDATMANMKTTDDAECVAGGEYYLNNEGTIICHGGHAFENTDKNASGLERMYTR